MTTQQYQQASKHFLVQARLELADGDLLPRCGLGRPEPSSVEMAPILSKY